MTREEWLQERKKGLGGSDIAAILGLSPWRGPLEVYADKRGLIEDAPDAPHLEWGRRLEGVVAQKYAEGLPVGLGLHRGDAGGYGAPLVGPEEWMRASPDGLVGSTGVDISPVGWGLEIKTSRSSTGWGDPGTDEIPAYYRTQVAWYQAVLGLDRWDVAVLIGGTDYREYTVRRDAELERRIVESARAFWFDHVVAGVPPAPGPQSGPTVAALYKQAGDEIVDAPTEATTWAYELRIAKEAESKASEQRAELENRIKSVIKEAAGLRGDGWSATWKASRTAERVVWEGVARNIAQVLGDEGAETFERVKRAHTMTMLPSRRFIIKWEKE